MKRKINWILMFVFACSMSAMAQTNTSSDSSMKKEMSGKKMSMTGCISGKDGKYMMMNKEHPDGVMLMSSDDLKPHMGHTVMVTGMMQKMEPASGDSMKSADKMNHDRMGMMGMKVNSMKMVSEHCDMSKMSDK